jgi:hypothetical protein
VTRRTEPRIAVQDWAALGDARTVLNVGAGTGSYEPPDRDVLAVEPSAVMRSQRPAGAAPYVAAVAGSLPFKDQSFDAARVLPPSITGRTRSPACAIGARVEPVLIPWDCADGFFEAYWRRPEAYLDEKVRRGVSVWAKSDRMPSRGQCAASALTSPLAGGPNATATWSISRQQSSAFAC